MSNQQSQRGSARLAIVFIAFFLLSVAAWFNLARKQEERRNAPPLYPTHQTAQPKRSI